MVKQLEETSWPEEYIKYYHNSTSAQFFGNHFKHTLQNDKLHIQDNFMSITFHNNPAFYETVDPDGIPFVSLRDPFIAMNFISPTTRFQTIRAFVKILGGNTEWIYLPQNSVLLVETCEARFKESEIITIDGESYTCKEWRVSVTKPMIYLTM